jgi:hypothetical protein
LAPPPLLPLSVPSSPPQAATASAMVNAPTAAANRVMRIITLLEIVLSGCGGEKVRVNG